MQIPQLPGVTAAFNHRPGFSEDFTQSKVICQHCHIYSNTVDFIACNKFCNMVGVGSSAS